MTIHYINGPAIEAVLLCESQHSIRVAARGACDALELTRVHDDFWVTPECEPVRVSFGGPPPDAPAPFVEEEFICPAGLAATLIGLVRGDAGEAGAWPASEPGTQQTGGEAAIH